MTEKIERQAIEYAIPPEQVDSIVFEMPIQGGELADQAKLAQLDRARGADADSLAVTFILWFNPSLSIGFSEASTANAHHEPDGL